MQPAIQSRGQPSSSGPAPDAGDTGATTATVSTSLLSPPLPAASTGALPEMGTGRQHQTQASLQDTPVLVKAMLSHSRRNRRNPVADCKWNGDTLARRIADAGPGDTSAVAAFSGQVVLFLITGLLLLCVALLWASSWDPGGVGPAGAVLAVAVLTRKGGFFVFACTIALVCLWRHPVSAVQLCYPAFGCREATAGSSTIAAVHAPSDSRPRPVPTPCRCLPMRFETLPARLQPPPGRVDDSQICADEDFLQPDWNGETLLQQALRSPDCLAFFQACTLLEVLYEHLPREQRDSTHTVATEPTILCLAESVPTTVHQKAALSLEAVLPHSAPPSTLADGQDWLDADLQPLLRDQLVPLEMRTSFANFRLWHHCGYPPPDCLLIYTDGSANSQGSSALDAAPCSWSFAVWAQCATQHFLIGFAAAQASPCHTPYHLLEEDDTALTGEFLALAWALTWLADSGRRLSATASFHYDALAAGQGVFGAASLPGPGPYERLSGFCVSLRQYVQTWVALSHAHVAGHSGHLYNELVDQLAKRARRLPDDPRDRCLPTWPAKLCQHPQAAWAWAVGSSQLDMPTFYCFEAEAHRLQQLGKVFTQAPMQGLHEVSLPSGLAHFSLCCVSLNVLTLRDPTHKERDGQPVGLRCLGRKGILKQALHPYPPHFVGLQETRLPEDVCQSDKDYHILQSGATDAGVGGCALWISKTRPYATCAGKDLYFAAEHFTATGAGPRHLVVTVASPHLLLQVSVLHAPSLANTPRQEVVQYWVRGADLIRGRPEGSDFIVLIDANARVGSVVSAHIQDHDFEVEGAGGELFHDFLVATAAAAPSTFPTVHQGPSGTWCTPKGVWHRLDYIVIPAEWLQADLTTRVLVEVELLQKRDDHLPVLLHCRFCKKLPALRYYDNRKKVVRPDLSSRESSAALAALANIPSVAWSVPVDRHYQTLTDAWHEATQTFCTVPEDRPIQAYLSVDTLHLARIRQALRGYLSQEAQETRRRRCLIAFAAFVLHWRQGFFTPRAATAADNWLRVMDVSEAAAVALLHWYGQRLRQAVAGDRRRYLQNLVSGAALRDLRQPRELYQAIRKAFPAARASRRSGIQPLPSLYRQDGTAAATTEERAECWRRHFAAQEGGEDVSPQAYLLRSNNMAASAPPIFDCAVLPTLGQMEQVVLNLKNNKAAGPDGITSEVLRVCPAVTTRQLLPVVLKSVLRLQEPTLWRGGNLFVLAKRASAKLTCDCYRSILVSCVPGKVYHRCVRAGLKPHLLASQPPLQAGIRDGVGLETPALAIRSFIALMDGLRQPWAVVFVDLAAAFYTVLRQSLVANPDTDEGFLTLLHSLQIPDEAVEELYQHLQRVAELPAQGVSPHHVEMIRDLFVGSWFRLSTQSTLVLTHRGSRPGDPLADLLFAFTLAAYLRQVNALLRQAGLLYPRPRPSSWPSWATFDASPDIGNPAWADDFTWPVVAPEAGRLIQVVEQGTSLLLGHASSIGMCLKFGVDKTAVLLSESVKQSAVSRLEEDALGAPCIRVANPCTRTTEDLPVVDAYKHLGGIVTSNSSPAPDLYHRFARADGTARPLRKCFFTSKQFSVAVRRALLRALVISKYTHTSAALILPAACHVKLWERHYISLCRNLTRRVSVDKTAHPFHVLSLASASSPALAIARARATFLAKLFSHEPLVLATLLVDHYLLHPRSSWLEQLRADVDCVALFVPSVRLVLPAGAEVAGLVEAAQDSPKWWLQTVKKAERLYQQDLAVWRDSVSSGPQTGFTLRVPDPCEPTDACSQPAEAAFVCKVCRKAFLLRKHLHLHMAKAHGLLSPARHYALSETCTACGKYYGSVLRVQQHLKHSLGCLKRCSLLHEPLSKDLIARLEAPAKRTDKSVKLGTWRAFTACPPPMLAPVTAGPRLPTAVERHLGLPDEEDVLLADLRPSFTPSPEILRWIDEFIEGKSQEGPRVTAVRFWQHKPSDFPSARLPSHQHVSNSTVLDAP